METQTNPRIKNIPLELECWTESFDKSRVAIVLKKNGFLLKEITPKDSNRKYSRYFVCDIVAEKPLIPLLQEWFYAEEPNGKTPYEKLEELRHCPKARGTCKSPLIYKIN